MRTWHFGDDGRVVVGNVFALDMEEARRMARHWNRGEHRPHMRIALVANAEKPAEATAVSAIA